MSFLKKIAVIILVILAIVYGPDILSRVWNSSAVQGMFTGPPEAQTEAEQTEKLEKMEYHEYTHPSSFPEVQNARRAVSPPRMR